VELNGDEIDLVRYMKAHDLSLCSTNNLFQTALACKYALENQILGDFVECGVYRGGNALIMAQMLEIHNVKEKKVWLYDTFAGMTQPTEFDVKTESRVKAIEKFLRTRTLQGSSWANASIDAVKRNMQIYGLNPNLPNFVVGDVARTLKSESNLPREIAVLRLDTDWH
jgi:O-methyltransferase